MIDAHKKYRKCKILKGEYKQRKFSGPDSLSKKYKYLWITLYFLKLTHFSHDFLQLKWKLIHQAYSVHLLLLKKHFCSKFWHLHQRFSLLPFPKRILIFLTYVFARNLWKIHLCVEFWASHEGLFQWLKRREFRRLFFSFKFPDIQIAFDGVFFVFGSFFSFNFFLYFC